MQISCADNFAENGVLHAIRLPLWKINLVKTKLFNQGCEGLGCNSE